MELNLMIRQANGEITTGKIFDALHEIWGRNRFNHKGVKRDHEEVNEVAGADTVNAVGQQQKKKTKNQGSFRVKCWLCNADGHTKRACPNVEQLKAQGVDVSKTPYRPKPNKNKKNSGKNQNQNQAQADGGNKAVTYADRDAMDSFNCFIIDEEGEQVNQIADPRWRNPKVLHADCAASIHMVPDRRLLRQIQPYRYPVPVTGALAGSQATLNEAGSLTVTNRVTLNNVAYCPKAQISLISEHRLTMSGRHVIIKDGRTSKLYDIDDVNIVENNPPLLTFVKRGCFWVKDLEGSDVNVQNMGGTDMLGRPAQVVRSTGSSSAAISAAGTGQSQPSSSSSTSSSNAPQRTIQKKKGRTNKEGGMEVTHSALIQPFVSLLKRLKNLEGEAVCALSEESMEEGDDEKDVDDKAEKEAKKIILSESVDRWHQRTGHCSGNKLIALNKKYRLRMDENEIKNFMRRICDDCIRSNIRRTMIHHKGNDHPLFDSIDSGMVLYIDAFGPVTIASTEEGKVVKKNCPSMNGDLYGLLGVEAKTTVIKYASLQRKNQIAIMIPVWVKQIEKELGRVILYLHSDNAKEIIGKDIKNFLDIEGIQFSNTTYYHPEHNGVVERLIGKIRSIARVLLISSGAPYCLWHLATEWAVFLHNNLPSDKLEGKTPMETYINYCFDVGNKTKIWGCDAYVLKSKPKRGKTEAKGWLGMHVGYSTRRLAYKIIDQLGEEFETRDVKFNEDSFKAMKIFAESVRTGVVVPKKGVKSGVDLIKYNIDEDAEDENVAQEKDDNEAKEVTMAPSDGQEEIPEDEDEEENDETPQDLRVADTPMNKLSYEERLHVRRSIVDLVSLVSVIQS